jgi:phosphatidylserine/phosphatidylglycerophosphate/cardiolipin synthase-like enzyme
MKLVLIDGRKAIAGSTNWTINSFVRWRETSFTLEGQPVARLMSMFEADWNRTKPCTGLTFKQRLVARLVTYLNKRDYGFW